MKMGLVPAEVVCPWSVRPGRGRTLGAALWALQCRLEHADQLGPVLWLLGATIVVDRAGRRPGAGGDQPDRGARGAGRGAGYWQKELTCWIRVPGAGGRGERLQEVGTDQTMTRWLLVLADRLAELG